MDLFLDSLENLRSIDVVEKFLGMELPENQRLREGSRLDFKKEIPDDLGVTVASFSNSFGGLILLGVAGKKSDRTSGAEKDNIPDAIVGIDRREAKQLVVSMILNSVVPTPKFSIGQCAVGSEGRTLLAIRVERGDFPPYMFTLRGRNKVPVRHSDGDRNATYLELEGLFAGRKAPGEFEGQRHRFLDFVATHRGPNPPHRLNTENHHSLVIIPWRPQRIMLDRARERKFTEQIRGAFVWNRRFNWQPTFVRSATHVDVHVIDEDKDYERKWRMTRDGILAFSGTLSLTTPELIGAQILDTVSGIMLARCLLSEEDYFGPIQITDRLSVSKAAMEAKSPDLRAEGRLLSSSIPGIAFPSRPVGGHASHEVVLNADFPEYRRPAGAAVDIFLDQLRQIYGAEFDRAALEAEVEELIEHQFFPFVPQEIRELTI